MLGQLHSIKDSNVMINETTEPLLSNRLYDWSQMASSVSTQIFNNGNDRDKELITLINTEVLRNTEVI